MLGDQTPLERDIRADEVGKERPAGGCEM